MVTDETPIREQVDAYVGREFHSFEEIMELPPCVLVNCNGLVLTHGVGRAGPTGDNPPYRVTHLLEVHEVPTSKSDAPELTLEAARRFTFEVRTEFVDEPMRLEIESPYGTWWYATLHAPGEISYLVDGGWGYSKMIAAQFATAEEALAAAWATPEIKGLA